MARTKDSELTAIEKLVMLALARNPDAKCVDVVQEIKGRTGKVYSVPTVYLSIRSLEKRTLVTARNSEPKAIIGGRSRKHFSISATGKKLLDASLKAIDSLRA